MRILKAIYSPFVRMKRSHRRQNTSDSDNGNCNKDAVAGPKNVKSLTKLIKLNNDCFGEIFEYLSEKELDSFGQICKRLKILTEKYYK